MLLHNLIERPKNANEKCVSRHNSSVGYKLSSPSPAIFQDEHFESYALCGLCKKGYKFRIILKGLKITDLHSYSQVWHKTNLFRVIASVRINFVYIEYFFE